MAGGMFSLHAALWELTKVSHLPDVLTFLFLCLALGWDACLVCGCLPSKRQEWCHHVSPVRHRDPAGDRHQQPSAQAEAAAGHPGDYVTNQPFCPTHIQDGKFTCSYALGGRTVSCKAMDQSTCFFGSLQPQQFSFKRSCIYHENYCVCELDNPRTARILG